MAALGVERSSGGVGKVSGEAGEEFGGHGEGLLGLMAVMDAQC